MKLYAAFFCGLFLVSGCSEKKVTYNGKYRPQYHFSSGTNWINDPNGLVYYDGEYHMFFQHNPFDNVWGHMTWGHAISKDLVHWQQLDDAIKEENGIMIFSGTCVVDKNNTSGFGKDGKIPMVAIYTGHTETNQSQCLAYSLDNGRTWTKYSKNPILDLGKKDFRDPKVFWYGPDNKWVMAVVLPVEKQIQFYKSQNLLQWELMSSFGPEGDTTGIWECPDLFEVPIADDPAHTKWILMHSPSPYMQYFVGDFDGTKFFNENPADKIFRPDYGPDYYAGIVFNNLPDTMAPVSIAWANNWNYANAIPSSPWKGSMSLPRSLSVKYFEDHWELIQQPYNTLEELHAAQQQWDSESVKDSFLLPANGKSFELKLTVNPGAGSTCGVEIGVGEKDQFIIGYNSADQKLFIDRANSGENSFSDSFVKMSKFEKDLPLTDNAVTLDIFVDESIVEVFADNGRVVMTSRFFPKDLDSQIRLFNSGDESVFSKIQFWNMWSIWNQ